MNLAVNPPVLPMLSKRLDELPTGDGWIYEPKWDGFRALIFRDGGEILIQSRDAKPLNRYFPELIPPLLEQLPEQYVLDGEIVVAQHGRLEFDTLQMRLHPAASRVKLLSGTIPASVVFFDLICEGKSDLRGEPFSQRRAKLESLLKDVQKPLHLTPATSDTAIAADWFKRFEGAGLDGVMAKPVAGIYEPNKRVIFKLKHDRECDCVVAGFRWHKKNADSVGSLLLGLFDDSGALQHVGVCSSFDAKMARDLVDVLAPLRKDALAHHPWKGWAEGDPQGRMPGGQSRWSQGKDLSWEALRPERVVEVAYDHMQGDRFRHTAHFRRWRPDKEPRDCTYAQLEEVAPHELRQIFAIR